MADVITRFKLETTQFDSKLRDTSKALRDIAHQAELGGKDFDKFSDEAIKSARALGTVQSGATNTKDRLRDLVGSYNDAAKAYNSLTETAKKGEFGRAMSQSLTQLQQRIRETKEELYGLGDGMKGGGGGLGGKFTDVLSVAGGNLLAQGVTKLTGELQATVQQSVELARAGEGIRVAFDKLNRPGLLANLREATHGTVTDIELMKAAVKFDDFKLPLEELGTMLAFAQKKAKDTGQSVDYMVDSIVTGLGRKSLMILDNLGLSAAQIKERMKDGGDMTKAVGEIIREEMAKAGDYVETAADRAARATAEVKNKMEELGRSAMPVAETFDKAWNTIKISGMSVLNTVLVPIAKSIKYINELLESTPQDVFEKAWSKAGGEVGSNVDDKGNYIRRPAQKGATGFDWDKGTWKPGYSGAIYNSATGQTELPEVNVLGHTPTKTTPTGRGAGGGRSGRNDITINLGQFTPAEGEKFELGRNFQSLFGNEEFINIQRKLMGMDGEQTRDWGKELGKVLSNYIDDPDKNKRNKQERDDDRRQEAIYGNISRIAGSVQGMFSTLEQMGIEIPDELKSMVSGVQSIMEFMSAMTALVSTIASTSTIKTLPVVGTFAHNGAVIHAAGGAVTGNTYSGDQIPAMLNAGEVVLNRSQVGSLASALSGERGGGQNAQPFVTGDIIFLGLQNYLQENGYGKLMTTNMR